MPDMNYSEKTHDPAEADLLYSVLNLNRAASQAEINERHRALSLIFHPDKQQSEESKEIATPEFLKVQKAYQVLSDPFLRDVYDTLGEEGLSYKWTPEFRSKPQKEVHEILSQVKGDIAYKRLEEQILPRGILTCGIDATSLFRPYTGSTSASLPSRVLRRLERVNLLNYDLRHSVQKTISEKTNVSVNTTVIRHRKASEISLLGTLRHQFSPRFSSEAIVTLLRPHMVSLSGTYHENGNKATVQVNCAPTTLKHMPPSLVVSLSRKLFRRRQEVASLELHVGPRPHLSLNLLSPTVFGLGAVGSGHPSMQNPGPPSSSGLSFGTTHKAIGLTFDSILPKLVGEWGINFVELALQLMLKFEFGITGVSWVFSGSWSNQTTEIRAGTQLGPSGVVLLLDATHMEQRLSVPVVLSVEPNNALAFWTLVLPSTAFVLGHYFVLRPRRRLARLAHIRAARQAQEEGSDLKRMKEATMTLLKDTARRSKQAEASKGGLVIMEATYGPIEKDNDAKDFLLDVTDSLQALVRNSQLYVPANQTKLTIHGFSDPAPFADKALCIRYLFRGQVHYAEVPDIIPVALPLSEHLVE